MEVTDRSHPANGSQRRIGPIGTTARVIVGILLVGSVAQGHLARGFHPSAWVLGLVGFPALLVGLQRLRARRTPIRLEATGPVAHVLNLAVFLVLYLLEPTSDATLIFYGASMWLAPCAAMPAVRSWRPPTGCLAVTTRSAAPRSGPSTNSSTSEPPGGSLGGTGTIVFDELGTTTDGSLHQRNVTIFTDGEVDRSPSGSGSASRVAVLTARGDLGPGQVLVHDSIVGSSFTCRAVDSLTADGHPAVIPQITGMANRCGTSQFTLDPHDPFVAGFVLR